MKQKLEAELKDLASKILEEKHISTASLKNQAKDLYEKLTIIAFTEESLEKFSAQESYKTEVKAEIKEEPVPSKEIDVPLQQQETASQEEKDEYLPDGTEYNDAEALTEPNTEKIKDIVAQMPIETQKMDFMVNNIIAEKKTPPITASPQETASKKDEEKDFRDIGVDYDKLPNFEPVKKQPEKERPKSINDRLKKGFNIGLNERLAFIRHLFEGNTSDYNRVISQLNTFDSVEEAKKFIQLVVKPDYKNWQGKEEFESKFMELVENKFRH